MTDFLLDQTLLRLLENSSQLGPDFWASVSMSSLSSFSRSVPSSGSSRADHLDLCNWVMSDLLSLPSATILLGHFSQNLPDP